MASPLTVFRKYQRQMLVALFVLLMISFLIVPHIEDYLRSDSMGGGRQLREVVMSWDGGEVREGDLRAMYTSHVTTMNFLQQLLEVTRQRGGQPKVPLPFRATSEGDVIETMLLAEKAQRMGFTLSDTAIRDYLDRVADETVDHNDLNEILQRATGGRMTVQGLYGNLRRELAALHMRQLSLSGVIAATPAVNWENFNRLQERVVLELLPVAVADFVPQVAAEPTAAEIEALFEKYKDQYPDPNRPEPGFRQLPKTDFAYLRLDFNTLVEQEKANVSDSEVQAEYEAGLKRGDFRRPQLPPATPGSETPGSPEAPAGNAPTTPATEPPGDAGTTPDSTPAPPPGPTAPPAPDVPPSPPESGDDQDGPSNQSRVSGESTVFVSVQEPAAPTPEGESTVEPAEPQAETPESSTPTEPAPPAEPATPAEKPAAEQPATEQPDASPPAPPENRTLDEARDQIVTKLARAKAQGRRNQAMSGARGEVEAYFQKYTIWTHQLTEEKSDPPQPLNLDDLAAKYGMTAGRTGLVDVNSVQETDLGKTSSFDQTTFSFRPFGATGFDPDTPLYKAREIADAQDSDIEYLYWKVEIQEEFVPKLSEVREEVVAAWKQAEARKLAEKRAEELREQAAAGSGSLKERLPEAGDKVSQTNEFSWLTMGAAVLRPMGTPQLSSVEGVSAVNWNFMKTVFAVPENGIGVTRDAPEKTMYVFRVARRGPETGLKREQFLRSLHTGGMELQPLIQSEYQLFYRDWYQDLERELNVKWARNPEVLVR